MKDKSKVINLFKTRDEAVKNQDRQLFLTTQISEITGGSSDGYLGIQNLKSEPLYIHHENELEVVAFVKETYRPKKQDSYSSFPVYYLTHTIKGWKIFKVK